MDPWHYCHCFFCCDRHCCCISLCMAWGTYSRVFQVVHLEVELQVHTASVSLFNAKSFSKIGEPITHPPETHENSCFPCIVADSGYYQTVTLWMTYILGPLLFFSLLFPKCSARTLSQHFFPPLINPVFTGSFSALSGLRRDPKGLIEVNPSWQHPLTLCILRPNIAISFKWVNKQFLTKIEVAGNN